MGPISTPTAEELDVWTFSNDHAMELMALGGFLGAFHVLTPDHLSALSALSVGGSWRSFALGVRWSMGHSGGLLIVTFVFLMLKGDLDLRLFGKYCDSMVGMFMIFIGFYGILGSLKTYTYKKQKRKDIEMRDIENDSANKHEKSSLHPSHSSDKVNMSSEVDEQEGMNTASEETDYLIHNQHSHHDFEGLGISESLAWIPFIDMEGNHFFFALLSSKTIHRHAPLLCHSLRTHTITLISYCCTAASTIISSSRSSDTKSPLCCYGTSSWRGRSGGNSGSASRGRDAALAIQYLISRYFHYHIYIVNGVIRSLLWGVYTQTR